VASVFYPETIDGAADPFGSFTISITGVTQDKLVPRFPLVARTKVVEPLVKALGHRSPRRNPKRRRTAIRMRRYSVRAVR
jgi:hypothetical protein